MAVYEYGRIHKLAESLEKAGIDRKIIDKIMAGGELISKTAKPEKKADWLSAAMDRMDDLLDEKTRYAVREDCACCLGGKRQEISKKIGKTYNNSENAVKAAREAKCVCGHSLTLEDDGRIRVSFEPEGKENYRCVCLPVSITYCYCCGGHVKHHIQNVLRRKVSCTVRSSALESGGKKPCTFLFSIVE